jgi:hypothetical protein
MYVCKRPAYDRFDTRVRPRLDSLAGRFLGKGAPHAIVIGRLSVPSTLANTCEVYPPHYQ